MNHLQLTFEYKPEKYPLKHNRLPQSPINMCYLKHVMWFATCHWS